MKDTIYAPSLDSLCPNLSTFFLAKTDVPDLHTLPSPRQDSQQEIRDQNTHPPPPHQRFDAAFSPLTHRHGDNIVLLNEPKLPRPVEAPAKLIESTSALPQTLISPQRDGTCGLAESRPPLDCGDKLSTSGAPDHHHQKVQCRKGKSFSTDLDREAAWERKKELYLHEEEEELCYIADEQEHQYGEYEGFYDDECEHELEVDSPPESDDDGRNVDKSRPERTTHGEKDTGRHADATIVVHSDVTSGNSDATIVAHSDVAKKHSKGDHHGCSSKMSLFRPPMRSRGRTRTRSLTDEDMEELRGSIDLGFGFSYNERSNLTETLPALELYYAINRNFADSQTRPSPEANVLVRTNSGGSTSTASHETWHISSPGDDPNQVKTRLRHWAQAVAFSVKQGY